MIDWRLLPASLGFREFNPCHHPAGSSEGGQFCSDTSPTGYVRTYADATAEAWDKGARDEVARVAAALQFPVDRIAVVDQEPKPFEVGGRQWKEAGHYNPTTGQVQINLQGLHRDFAALTMVSAHEIAHAKWEVFYSALQRESRQTMNWARTNEKAFRMNGDIRPEYASAFKRMFPAHAAIADTWGHGYMSQTLGQKMQSDDGFTDYSKAYWAPVSMRTPGFSRKNYLGEDFYYGPMTKAMNETLAEVAGWQANQKRRATSLRSQYRAMAPHVAAAERAAQQRYREIDAPSKEWRRLAARINAFYRSHVKRGGRG